jgi:carboxypeptidase T
MNKKNVFRLLVLSLLALTLLAGTGWARDMLVRVYVPSWQGLKAIPGKGGWEIAGAKLGEYYELVVSEEAYARVKASGLRQEVIYEDLSEAMRSVAGQYHTWPQVVTFLRTMASTYPAICQVESIGPTYNGNWIYGVKITLDPSQDYPNRPYVLFEGLHHGREWPAIETPLFIADSLTRGYAGDPQIQQLVNNRVFYIFPAISHDQGNTMWRKDREPFGGSIGTDPSRNYSGANFTDQMGEWGALTPGSQTTHRPSNDAFCGPRGMTAREVAAITSFFGRYEFNACISYHQYGELLLWPWGYLASVQAPDDSMLVRVGTHMAGLITCESDSGTYTPMQSAAFYPTNGTEMDWIYGWGTFERGENLFMCSIEQSTSFQPPEGNLDQIVRENSHAALYLAWAADTIRRNMIPFVAQPRVVSPDTSPGGSFRVTWTRSNPRAPTDVWELKEWRAPMTVHLDSMENGSPWWVLSSGVSISTTQSHSPTHSVYLGNGNNISNAATTAYPYIVSSGESLTFWIWYDTELNYDVCVPEISQDGREWFQLDDRYNGYSGDWIRKATSLDSWVGKSVYFRFRYMTNDGTTGSGVYVDDIRPVPVWATIQVVSSAIPDTFYNITGRAQGTYYYAARGHNNQRGWGDFGQLKRVGVGSAGVEGGEITYPGPVDVRFGPVSPNPLGARSVVRFWTSGPTEATLTLYDVQGRLLRTVFSGQVPAGEHLVTWDGRNAYGQRLPAGVYFFRLEAEGKTFTEKAVLLR